MKTAILAVLAALALGYGAGRYLQPPKIQEKIVTKTVEKRDIKVVTRTIVKKDGTTEVTKVETDKTTTDTATKTEIKLKPELYKVEAMAGLDHGVAIYGASVSKKFIWNISLGAFGLTNGTFGLTTGVSF